MLSKSGAPGVFAIRSRRVSFQGPSGLQIVGFVDEAAEASWNERVLLLAPRYGETKKNNLQLAYTFAANGFKVLRFDQTNHIGESDGKMTDFTLSGAAADISAAVDFIDQQFEPAQIALVALSLSCRCGFRACARDERISRFASLVGMVDMDRTLKAIYKRDFFGELSAGAEWRMVDILGFEIDGKHFHDDLVAENLKTLDGTLADAEKVKIPVLHLYAANDRWVDPADVEKVIGRCAQGRLALLPDVGHEINENKRALESAVDQVLRFCLEGLPQPEGAAFRQPDPQELMAQNRRERKRMQSVLQFTGSEDGFWSDYLGKFGIIEEAHYYIEYFNRLSDDLGLLRPRDVLLDAGCGNGFFGIILLRKMLLAAKVDGALPGPLHYHGVDLTPEGLNRSYSRHTKELIELHREVMTEAAGATFSYNRVNLDTRADAQGRILSLGEGSIDKVCCSLVVSYLKEPLSLFTEIRRVLKPGGVAVISSMKPGCDMTVLYHDYLSVDTPTDESNQDATKLLSAAGRIKMKKDLGIYNFFTGEELERLAFDAGFTNIRSSRSFGNQANVVRVVK